MSVPVTSTAATIVTVGYTAASPRMFIADSASVGPVKSPSL
jgi:hypothetical protein